LRKSAERVTARSLRVVCKTAFRHTVHFEVHRAKFPRLDQSSLKPEASLPEEDRPGRVQLDREGDQQNSGARNASAASGDQLIFDQLEPHGTSRRFGRNRKGDRAVDGTPARIVTRRSAEA